MQYFWYHFYAICGILQTEVIIMYKGSPDKVRMNITIEKELKAKLETLAKEEHRSLNSLIIYALFQFVDKM